jgi:hypothetical protein
MFIDVYERKPLYIHALLPFELVEIQVRSVGCLRLDRSHLKLKLLTLRSPFNTLILMKCNATNLWYQRSLNPNTPVSKTHNSRIPQQ